MSGTAGDPGGIGPEIVCRFFSEFTPSRSTAVILGAPEVIRPWAEKFDCNIDRFMTQKKLAAALECGPGKALFCSTGCEEKYTVGRDSRGGGLHGALAVEAALGLIDTGMAGAIVTAPLSKKSLNLAGYSFTGHTEMLAEHFDGSSVEMMMVHDDLRIVPLTRHMPLKEVCSNINKARIIECVKTVDKSLRELFEIPHPRIAFAALNPHAGDRGLLGAEEIKTGEPALAEIRSCGINIDGPIPGDVVFQSIGIKRYDAYIAAYHDQGLIPFKMVAGKKGVNLSVGLPVIRTSVDHGTAFDIAGRGGADAGSLKEAYLLAEKLALRLAGRAKTV